MRWSRGAEGRDPRFAQRLVILFFCRSGLRPEPDFYRCCWREAIADFRHAGGEVERNHRIGVLRMVARPRREFALTHRPQRPADRRLIHRVADPGNQVDQTPSHGPHRDRASTTPAKAVRCAVSSRGGVPGDLPSTKPSGSRVPHCLKADIGVACGLRARAAIVSAKVPTTDTPEDLAIARRARHGPEIVTIVIARSGRQKDMKISSVFHVESRPT